MADFGSPPTANYTPPDPLKTISGLMSLKQQQLQMQGQVSQNQSLQAKASIDTQSAQENQNISQLVADPVKNGILSADGSPTDQAQQIILKAAPTTGAARANDIISAAKSGVDFKKGINSLSEEKRNALSGDLSAAAAGNLDDQQTRAMIAGHVEANPQLASAAMTMVGTMPQRPHNAGPQQMQAYQQQLKQWQIAMGRATSGASNAAGYNQVSTSPVNQGGKIGLLQTTPAGGAGMAGSLPVSTAPTIVTTPAGPLATVAPGGGSMTPIGAPNAGAMNLNATKPEVEAATGQSSAITGRVAQAQQQANNTVQTQDALSRAVKILESGTAANAGAAFEQRRYIKNFLAGVGIDTQGAEDTNSLVKNLARYEAGRATAAGLGGTDAARELAHNGSPNTSVDNAALLDIAKQSLATEKAIAAYGSAQSKSTNPQVLQKNENDFRNIPNVIQGYEYGMTKSPQEADAYLQKRGLTKDDMKKTRTAIKEFESR